MKSFLLLLFATVAIGKVSAQDTARVSLLFAGDVMGHDSQISSAYDVATRSYDYTSCFSHIKPYIEQADVAIANLEVTLAGPPYKGYPQFSSPDALAATLKESGFDVLVTANNHCVDRGKRGLERTIKVLDSLKIPHTGTFKDTISRVKDNPLMIYKNGFSIALLNYTYGTNGLPVYAPNVVNRIDTALIRKDLLSAKKNKPDVIIVFTHWGNEYERLPSKYQKDVGEFCFKHGADLVIGAHPHVIQPMEWRKEKNQFIAYSLGNFVSGQRKQYTDGGSLAYVELSRVRFSKDSAVTNIDSAGYFLEWVYRTADAKKDYYIMPVSATESNDLKFIKGQESKGAFRQFVTDSRSLYTKYNKNVREINTLPLDTITVYKVLLLRTKQGEDPWKLLTSHHDYVWGIDHDTDEYGNALWTSGMFKTEQQAEAYRQRYVAQHPEAQVVKYINGKRAQ